MWKDIYNIMKKITIALSAAFIVGSLSSVNAEFTRDQLEEATGISVGYNTSWSSQYVWRGESQSSKDMSPAVGVDLGHSSVF